MHEGDVLLAYSRRDDVTASEDLRECVKGKTAGLHPTASEQDKARNFIERLVVKKAIELTLQDEKAHGVNKPLTNLQNLLRKEKGVEDAEFFDAKHQVEF